MELIVGQDSTNLLFWIGVTVDWAGGHGIAARAGVGQRLKGSTSKPPKPDKTGDLGACWSTSRGCGCGSKQGRQLQRRSHRTKPDRRGPRPQPHFKPSVA